VGTAFFLACGLAAFTGVASGQSAADEMNAGLAAVQQANYQSATMHLERALQLDPELIPARIKLAECYAALYVPGGVSPENRDLAEKALAQYLRVLNADSPDVRQPQMHAYLLKQLASLNFNMKRLNDAADLYKRVIGFDDQDAGAYFSLAVIDWMQAYKVDEQLRNELKLQPIQQVSSETACARLRAANQKKVADGISNLQKALEICPDYDDAMAYMNLLYRQKAEYECDDAAGREADLKTADEWVDRAMESKKKKSERGQSAPQ
jgi:tetratricopeptide (TPR) repeat protein